MHSSRPLGTNAPRLVSAALLFVTGGLPLAAQSVVDVGAFSQCKDCRLAPRELRRFGDASGAGIIEANNAEVRYNPATHQYAVFHIGGSRILLFDVNGKFLRSIGRKGEGPAEISELIDVQFLGANIIAMNYAGPKFMVFDSVGAVLRESRFDLRTGRFRVTSESTVVIGSMDRSPATVGYPLHLTQIATGKPLKHFGSVGGEWSIREPFAEAVLLGRSPVTSRIWRGSHATLRAEEWDIEGRLLRTVRGDLSWLSRPAKADRRGPPAPILTDFGVDAQGRLWTIVQVADPKWRDAPREGVEGYVTQENLDKLYDARVDVFDLQRQQHLGSLVWDEAYTMIAQLGSDFGLQKVVYDANDVPRVALYRLDFGPTTPRKTGRSLIPRRYQ